MKNEQFVFGKDLSSQKKEEIAENINKIKEQAKQKVEGEYEKTQDELKFIGMINTYIEKEFQDLKIANFHSLRAEQFHLVNMEAYKKLDAGKDFVAFVIPIESATYINKNVARHRLELYKTILHESIHLCSSEKNRAVNKNGKLYISNYRKGYANQNIEDAQGKKHEHFRGFNEAVTDLIAIDILKEHKNELVSNLKIKLEEEQLPVSFTNYKKLLIEIMHKIAKKNNEKVEDVWKRFKRGYFTGDMMHLRDVEKTFGKGSLRFLAAIYSGTTDTSIETDKKIFRFFETDDENEREQISQEVLNKREKTAYQKRRS